MSEFVQERKNWGEGRIADPIWVPGTCNTWRSPRISCFFSKTNSSPLSCSCSLGLRSFNGADTASQVSLSVSLCADASTSVEISLGKFWKQVEMLEKSAGDCFCCVVASTIKVSLKLGRLENIWREVFPPLSVTQSVMLHFWKRKLSPLQSHLRQNTPKGRAVKVPHSRGLIHILLMHRVAPGRGQCTTPITPFKNLLCLVPTTHDF